jgi:hypothetical protein
MSNYNDWDVSYSTISFFESALQGHDKVLRVSRTEDILFQIELVSGDTINVLLVDEYTLGLAAVLKARKEFPTAEHIVTGGKWNAYTKDAKKYGWQNKIGIFKIDEFFGALNWDNPIKYHKKDDDGNPVYAYRSA